MQTKKILGIVLVAMVIVGIGFVAGRHVAFQDLKADVQANDQKIEEAKQKLIDMKASCDALFYGW